MKSEERRPGSLKWGLTLATLLCWILPIIIVTAVAAASLNYYYDRTIKQTADAGAENAMRQAELRLASAIEDSKAVSYEGIVRQAYREYQHTHDRVGVYRTVTEYLSQKYSRNASFSVIYISFLDEGLDLHPYAAAQGSSKYNLLRNYTDNILPAARECIGDADAGIFFFSVDGNLYMVRNLLDNRFQPYALMVMGLEKSVLLQSLYSVNGILGIELSIDGVRIPLDAEPIDDRSINPVMTEYTAEVEGHSLAFTAQTMKVSIWSTMPALRYAILAIILLVLPLVLLIILLFHRNINHPIDVLIEANTRVQAGERGYTITERAPSQEFRQLYSHFNSMSSELKNQFDRIYLEQQALQEARIKALQSQINPHFLNNTLEIINWEARLADNEQVCSMIEALSTMLDAAVGRDGRSQAPLSEELKYVDAYLYITKERLGERLTVSREIEKSMLGCQIPRLMLQPIIENAVEHDISRSGGELSIRAYRSGGLCFEIEHEGQMSDSDWDSVRRSLDSDKPFDPERQHGGSVGIRNVNQRLRLIYGDKYSFSITEPRKGRILARIVLPEQL